MTDNSMRELRNHGNTNFPIAIYERDTPGDKGKIVEKHWHDEWEFFALDEGSVLFFFNGMQRLLHRHDIVLVPAGSIHMAETYKNTPFRFRSIVFSEAMLYGSVGNTAEMRYVKQLATNHSRSKVFMLNRETAAADSIYPTFDKLYGTLASGGEFYEMFAKAQLYELMAHTMTVINTASKNPRPAKEEDTVRCVKKAIHYMLENLQSPLTLPVLAAHVNMSPGHFGKHFKDMTSCSPIEYLINLRLSKAAEKLVNTEEQIIQIAYDVGYNNIGHFIRSFEKKYGLTPRKYRQTQSASKKLVDAAESNK